MYSDLSQILFGVPWEEVDPGQLAEFLKDAGEEGLYWEAKSEPTVHLIRKAVCGFANTERGGFVLLGVSGSVQDGWELEGFESKSGEPGHWVGQIVQAGVSPTPTYDIHSFSVNEGRALVVIGVDPVAVPPCITNAGQVYERTSRETIPVTDPTRLATLFERGESGHANAEASSDRAAAEMLSGRHLRLAARKARFSLALTAVAYPPDITGRLFTAEFGDAAEAAGVAVAEPPGGPIPPSISTIMRQDRSLVLVELTHAFPCQVLAGGVWTGTAACLWSAQTPRYNLEQLINRHVRVSWRGAASLVRRLGGYGPAHLTIEIPVTEAMFGPEIFLEAAGGSVVVRYECAEVTEPTDEQVARILREVERSAGAIAHEPADDSPEASEPTEQPESQEDTNQAS